MATKRASWETVFNVLRRHLPAFQPGTIFDVGANVGDTTEIFATRFPGAWVHAFEPVPSAFVELEQRTRPFEHVRCHEIALSDRVGSAWMDVPQNSRMARIVASSDGLPHDRHESHRVIKVACARGDAFCSAQGIDGIDFLKVDTEGQDLAVLRGFEGLLASQKVGLVDVEVGISPDNERHVPLVAVKSYLEPLGYLPFWLNELTLDHYFSGRPVLRRVNAIYISHVVVTANTVAPRGPAEGETDDID